MRPGSHRRASGWLLSFALVAPCALAQTGIQKAAPQSSAIAASATARALRAAGVGRITEDKGTVRATVVGDSLWDIAGAVTAGSSVDRNQAMVAIFRANPQAFTAGNIHRVVKGVSLVIPPLAEMRAEGSRQAAELVAQHRVAVSRRDVAPMPLYGQSALAASAALAGALSEPPVAPTVSPAAAPARPASVLAQQQPSASAAPAQRPAAPSPVQWWPALLLVGLAAVAVVLFLRRRTASPFDDDEAAVEHASRLFVDSRLELESQLEAQPGTDSEPLYSTLDEPVDAAPIQAAQPRPAPVLVLRNGRAAALEVDPVPVTVSGDALALALTVAHAYADVGRPEASRRWLRAIDARGAAAFDPGA